MGSPSKCSPFSLRRAIHGWIDLGHFRFRSVCRRLCQRIFWIRHGARRILRMAAHHHTTSDRCFDRRISTVDLVGLDRAASINFRVWLALVGVCRDQSPRKPLTKSRSEKRPTLNAQSATISLSQWPTQGIASANRRKRRQNSAMDIFSINIRDLLADQRGFKLPIGFSKYPFEMSAEFPLLCRKMAD